MIIVIPINKFKTELIEKNKSKLRLFKMKLSFSR